MPEEIQKTQRLDPDAPLVLDVRRLGRRPGSMIRVSRSVPAPADLGLPVIGVPEGATIELDLRLAAVTELFVFPGRGGDDETRWLQDDLIDLEPTLRDAVVLLLPLSPVCEDDCPGLCVECGARLADDPGHEHRQSDPRWAALQGLVVNDEQE